MRAAGRLLGAMPVLVWLACPLAFGQASEARQGDAWFHGWKFDVAPFYLWLPALDGTVTVRETSASVDQSGGDTLDLLFDSFKFGATGRAEARKGNALLTLDLLYMDLGENVQTDVGAGVTVRSKQLILEFGGGYHLLDWSVAGEGTPSVSVDVLAGRRYVDLDSGITIENALDVDRSQDWLDPFVGGRLTVNIIDRLSVAVRGDIGGFGVGSHVTWNMAAILAYQVSQRMSIGAGYRILDINYSEGTGAHAFRYDVQMRGPVLGLDIRF
ncbi:MAG: hypothetical protein ACRERE_40565 [Candidatus Entotheonellia bacterium]